MTPAADPRRRETRPDAAARQRIGLVATATVAVVLFAWALTVDFPKVTTGFFSDGSTYYTLAHSLAHDLDFEYRREDAMRVWREYRSGPEGIFLKRGRDVQGVAITGGFPFFTLTTNEDWDRERLYYGKSFIFPLFAAPFVKVFGTNGFLVFHALLMTICFACAYAFLVARNTPVVALLFAGAFLFVSVAPIYMVWLTPDFFNLALVLIAYFFWTYKEVRTDPPLNGRMTRWFTGFRSDLVAAALLGIATFSKPIPHVILMLPILALLATRRQWTRGVIAGVVFSAVLLGLFGWNIAITGEWNYQGGEDRKTFYAGDPDGGGPNMGGFPFQTATHTWERTGIVRGTNKVLVDVLTTRETLLEVFPSNVVYFLFGRHHGFVPYFLPGAIALVLFVTAGKTRARWQWLVLAACVGSAVTLLLYMPFTYSGGGGPIGNRYYLGVYPLFLYLTPPIISVVTPIVTIALSALFTAQLLSNPFWASFHPAEHVKKKLFPLLPAELSLVNDLPIGNSPTRSRQPLGGTPPISGYFLDDNVYQPEPEFFFWVRGESRAEIMLRAPSVTEQTPQGEVGRGLRVPRMEIHLETGPLANRVTIDAGAGAQTMDVPASERRSLVLNMPRGLPYKPYPENPINYVYLLSIESETGFIPMFDVGGGDNRFLGIRVRLVPLYE